MRIGDALEAMRDGAHVARAGWNGKNMWLCYASGGTFKDIDGLIQGDLLPFIVMKTAQGALVPWLCSQADMLADDWELASE
jgi:hypothetical protein